MLPSDTPASVQALRLRTIIIAALLWSSGSAYSDDSFGPPEFVCGGEGELPCTEGGESVDAIDVGKAQQWGCPGKNLYFTPHGGGECWSCPSGYRRTAKPIHKRVDACSKRGWGNDKRNSTYVRKSYGCQAGQFHRKGRCLECPGANDKVKGWLGINPKGRCLTQPGCDSGLVAEAGPPDAITAVGRPFEAKCTAETDPLQVIVEEGANLLKSQVELTGLAIAFATEVSSNRTVKDAIKAEDGNRLWRAIQGLRSFQRLRTAAQADGYKSISLGSVADVQLIVGANQEAGVAFDWTGAFKPYTTTGVSAGVSIGVDAGYTLGVWKGDLSQMSDYAQGAVVSLPTGTPGIGPSVAAAVWFSYAPITASGFTITAGVGVGAELGELNATWTAVY